MSFEQELALARRIVETAGALALRYRAEGFSTESKDDESPVTTADRACERSMAEAIQTAFPSDGLLGEEGARQPSSNGRRWILDPIDGTRDFVRGNRFWANFAAFEQDGIVQVGVCGFPALGETYWAARGSGAWRVREGREERIHASAVDRLDRAVLCGNLVKKLHGPGRDRFITFVSEFWAVRGTGGALDAMLVAAGQADVWLEPSAHPWDFAPLQVIAEEAGALCFGFDGTPGFGSLSGIICAPALEAQVREWLIAR